MENYVQNNLATYQLYVHFHNLQEKMALADCKESKTNYSHKNNIISVASVLNKCNFEA